MLVNLGHIDMGHVDPAVGGLAPAAALGADHTPDGGEASGGNCAHNGIAAARAAMQCFVLGEIAIAVNRGGGAGDVIGLYIAHADPASSGIAPGHAADGDLLQNQHPGSFANSGDGTVAGAGAAADIQLGCSDIADHGMLAQIAVQIGIGQVDPAPVGAAPLALDFQNADALAVAVGADPQIVRAGGQTDVQPAGVDHAHSGIAGDGVAFLPGLGQLQYLTGNPAGYTLGRGFDKCPADGCVILRLDHLH